MEEKIKQFKYDFQSIKTNEELHRLILDYAKDIYIITEEDRPSNHISGICENLDDAIQFVKYMIGEERLNEYVKNDIFNKEEYIETIFTKDTKFIYRIRKHSILYNFKEYTK